MTDANRPTEGISSERLRELIEVYNLQCFRGDTALALEELERLRHYVATCGGTDNDGRCPMHHLAGVSPGARAALNELHQMDQDLLGKPSTEPGAGQWQPIETLEDGVIVLVSLAGSRTPAIAVRDRSMPGRDSIYEYADPDNELHTAIAWMPLPAPYSPTKGEKP